MDHLRKYFELLLRRLFDIRDGEFRRAILMQLNIFLIISTLLIVKPTVNGLFLSRFGADNLPYAFVLVALFAGLVSLLYARFLSYKSLDRIMQQTLIWSVISLVVFGALLRLNVLEGWVIYLFYIWVAIFAVLSASQFWVLANIVFNAREAKRLFGFIGAGAIAGGIFGGYLTSLLAESLRAENLLFVAAFLLSFCIPITRIIWKKEVMQTQTHIQRRKRTKGFGDNPLALIRKSRHLVFIATLIGIGVIVSKLVDYQFSAIASANIRNPDDLTAFFGFWFSNFNVISLVIQLFITRKVVGVFGVGTSLFILPIGIMVGSLLVLVFPELWAVIFLKMIDGSLKQSVNKSGMELLALPVPTEIKNQTKSFIDVFVDSAATGVGGLILIFLVNGLDLSTRFISLMILLLFLGWIYFVKLTKKEYLKSIKLRVSQLRDDSTTAAGIDFNQESVLSGLQKVLRQGTEKQILFVLHKIKELPDDRMTPSVAALLHNPSPTIKAEAITCLNYLKAFSFLSDIRNMTRDSNQQVKIAAFDFLMNFTSDKVSLLKEYLKDYDYHVRGAALVSLAAEVRNNPDLGKIFDLENRVNKKIDGLSSIRDQDELRFRKINLLKTISQATLQHYYPFIHKMMEENDPDIVNQAIQAAGNALHPEFITPLLEMLGKEQHREVAENALSNYGQAIIDYLTRNFQNKSLAPDGIKLLPSMIEKIGTQHSVEFLFMLLDHPEIGVRLEALRSLNQLKIKYPHLKYHKKTVMKRVLNEAKLYLETITALYAETGRLKSDEKEAAIQAESPLIDARQSLIRLLERRLDGNLERIFRLLGLKYPPDDIFNIYHGLQSDKADLRTNAIEFLDNLLDTNLKRLLIPIAETAILENISGDALKSLNLKIPGEFQCFSMLLSGSDVKVNLAVLYLIRLTGDKKYIPLIANHTQSENPKIRTFAKEALTELLKE